MGAGHSVGVNTCLKLAEIGTIQGVESLHRHEIFCVMLPISLGLGVLSSCFFDSLTGFFFFFFFRHHLIYLASLVDLDGLPPETELSL